MKKPKTSHSSFYKGSKIRMIFRDGTVTIGKFVEKLSKKEIRVELASGTKRDIRLIDLRSCNYYKPLQHELPT